MCPVKRNLLCCCVAVCLGLPFGSQKVLAESPVNQLLRLVPEDVGFCAVLENLREHNQALARSPFLQYFKSTPVAAELMALPELHKLEAVDQYLQEHFHVSTVQLCNDILGDALVLCYRPGPPGKPDQEQGLVLLYARNEKLLADLVEEIQNIQKESGDLQNLEQLSYRGLKYYRRSENSKPCNYYFLHGPILGFSPQELILKQAMDLTQTAVNRKLSLPNEFQLLGVDRPLAALWINPRAFDAGLAQKLAEAKGPQASALRTVQTCWRAIDGIAVSLGLNEDIEVSLAVRGRSQGLSEAARRLASTAGEPSRLWQRFPEHSLLAVAVRIDVAALLEFVQELLGQKSHGSTAADVEKALGAIVGKDSVRDLISQLGPDLGFAVFPPASGSASWMMQGLAALRVHGESKGNRADLTIYNLVNTLGTLAVYNLNEGRPGGYRLKTTILDGIEIKHLENDNAFPVGFRPAFALKSGYLVLATSPEAITSFQAWAGEPRTHFTSGEMPFLRVSFRALNEYLNQHKSELAKYLAGKNRMPVGEGRQRLSKMQDGLQLLGTLHGYSTVTPDRAILTLRLSLARPLR